jgi:ABC-2 type transport system permease protein
MTSQIAALVGSHLSDRRRSLLAWGLPLGIWSAFVVGIYPSVEDALATAVENYPEPLKEAFGVGDLSTVTQYLNAEMLSLIAPLAVGYLAARAVASGLTGAAESGRLDVLLSAPVSRQRVVAASFAGTAAELAIVLAMALALTMGGSAAAGAGLPFGDALAGFANVWPLSLFTAAIAVIATAWSLRTSVVTGVAAGALVTMYVLDLVGRLDPGLDELRYASVFKYYGNASIDGLDAVAFAGLTLTATILAAVGGALFERRDLAA